MKQSEILSDLKGVQHGFCNATDSGTVYQPILMNQVHSADALFLTEPPVSPPMADALITQTPNLCLTVKTADCAPVLMADPTSGMVAAIHAGWRGAFQGILENTVLQMIRHGADPNTIYAAVGPHIQRNSFVAGTDMYTLFPKTEEHFFTRMEKNYLFDFDAYVIYRLRRAGVAHIGHIPDDTYTDPAYFSYRRDPANPGRQYSFIVIGENYDNR